MLHLQGFDRVLHHGRAIKIHQDVVPYITWLGLLSVENGTQDIPLAFMRYGQSHVLPMLPLELSICQSIEVKV